MLLPGTPYPMHLLPCPALLLAYSLPLGCGCPLTDSPSPLLSTQVRLQEDGFGLEPLQPGCIMAERYIRMRSMVSLVSMEQGAAIPDLIGVLARWEGGRPGGMGGGVRNLQGV